MPKTTIKLCFAIIGILAASNAPSVACGPTSMSTTFLPSCRITAASVDDEVVVVKLSDAQRRVVSVTAAGRQDVRMGLVDIDIRPGAKPVYLVLSSYHPVIWRIKGSTDSLSRVVALGSIKEGAHLVGVAGVPREKIEFPEPDFSTYAQGAIFGDKVQPSMCDFVAKACAPDTFLFRYPSSPTDKSAVIVRRIRPLLSARGAKFIAQRAALIATEQSGRANFSTVAAGVVPIEYLADPQIVERPHSDASARVSVRSDKDTETDGLVMLAPDEVVSPVEVTP